MSEHDKKILAQIVAYHDNATLDNIPPWLYMALEAIRYQAKVEALVK